MNNMTKQNMKKIELLAPAGSFESLKAAINAGADAVYFGIGNFNMRASAARNFQLEDLPEVVKTCHKNNVKAYVALNTVLYNNELERMQEIINKIKSSGADALIAADIAAIKYTREIDLEVHISTQLSISNTESLKHYAQFADRVVLARELSLEQVKSISEDIRKQTIKGPKGELIELEAFAHGALCVAVSGRCAMSLYCYGRSANRGQCAQVCRREYKITDIETGKELVVDNNYVMSAADLCTIGMLPELLDAGITILKIEGRGRQAEYVDTVISTYKKALKAIDKGEYTQANIEKWLKDLESVYNRGFTQGFYMGRKLDEWSGARGSKASEEKTLIGVVQKYYPKAQVVQVKILAKDIIKEGEKFAIIGPTTGIVKGKLTGMLVNDKAVKSASQNDIVTFKLHNKRTNTPARHNDKFYIIRPR